MSCLIAGVNYFLPENRRSNEHLVAANAKWDAAKIYEKTGIRTRPIAAHNETAADLGFMACEQLFRELEYDRSKVDVLLFCTQSPDYCLPSSACIMQNRLGLPTECGALDFNLGCSGFTYGLWMANALIESGSAENVVLVTADTYSKYCRSDDLTTASLFGDAGAACLLCKDSKSWLGEVGPSIVGTDGQGAENLIVRVGGARTPSVNESGGRCLYMNGPEIFSFTLSTVQSGITKLLKRVALDWEDIDVFLFHQANRFMLEKLRDKMGIATSKMPIDLEDTGNTVSASIPILMRRSMEQGLLKPGFRCVLVGFGVGYSWGMTLVNWRSN